MSQRYNAQSLALDAKHRSKQLYLLQKWDALTTRLYRGTQAYVYPGKDLGILDATIKGVVRGR